MKFSFKIIIALSCFLYCVALHLAAATYYSKANGNWGTAGTWGTACGSGTGAVPGAADNVIICAGHTVTMNVNGAQCNSLTINGTAAWSQGRTTNVGSGGVTMNGGTITWTGGGGPSGTLNVSGPFNVTGGTNNIGKVTLPVTGTTTISTGAIVNLTDAGGTFTFTNLTINGTFNNTVNIGITINGSLQNNGTYSTGTGTVTFGGTSNTTITGTSTTAFTAININKGTNSTPVLDIQSVITLVAGGLTLTNGTIKFSNASINITPFTVDVTGAPFRIPATTALWCNGATINSGNINWSVAGTLRISSGTVNLGNTADNRFIAVNNGTTQLIVEGGSFNVAGRITRVAVGSFITFNMSGGTIVVPTVGSTSTTEAPIMIDQGSSSFTFSNGTIIIQRAGGGASNLGFTHIGGTASITGGTLQIGNASTPASQTIGINTAYSVADFRVSSSNATAILLQNIAILQALNITVGTLNANNFNITLGNTWTNAGTFIPGNGTVIFNGTGTQTITKTGGETFGNFTVNKPSGVVSLANNITVGGTLNMTSGNILCNSNTLTIGTGIASTGNLSYTAGTVVGSLRRWVNSTGTGILFPIGTASFYRPSLVTFNSLTGGTLQCSFVSSNPGSNGLPLSESGRTISNQFTEGYWDLIAADGLTSADYNIELTGNGFTSYTVSPSVRLMYRAITANPWSLNGTHIAASGNTAKRNNISGLSAQFAFGKTDCSTYSATAITGNNSVCVNTTGEPYSVTNNPDNTYTWVITGGVVATGQGTSSITVDWGSTGMIGDVQVTEQNDCAESNTPINLQVYVNPINTSSITGLTNVAMNETGVAYSVTNTPGYTYTWSFPSGGGTIASGQGTNSVTVDWGGTPGTYSLRVDATRLCGGPDFQTLSVTIRAPILSSGSGNWTQTGTWIGGIVPTNLDYVEIQSGHTVNMNGNPGACYQLKINGTANWAQARTTNVGAGGIIINSTGNVTGTANGVLTTSGGITGNSNSNISSTTVNVIVQTNAGQSITGDGAFNKLQIDANANNSGNITIANGGTLNGSAVLTQATGSTLNMNGNFLVNVDASTNVNTVIYGATANQTVKSANYYNLTLSGSGTKTMDGVVSIINNLNISGVTFDVSSNNYALNIGGNWNNTGTFNSQFGTVTFNGNSAQSITNASGETFHNLNMTGTGTKTANNNITINFDFTLSSTFDAGNSTVNIYGNWDNSGTYISQSNNDVIFSNNTSLLGLSTTNFKNVTINGTVNANSSQLTVSGSWINNGNFIQGTSTVTFDGSTTITGSSASSFHNINITGTLTPASGNTNISGNYNNTGTFNHNNGTLTFNGTSAQTIQGNNTFKNLTINNTSGGVSVSSGSQNLLGTLTLTNGTFNTNNNFTLISDPSGTARIAEITGGDITGNINMQRYLAAGNTDWRQLGSAVSGVTLADWKDDFAMSGFPGSNQPGYSFVSVYSYDETQSGGIDNGWAGATNITNPIDVGKGFLCYVGDGPTTTNSLTFDLAGNTNKGNINLPISYTNTGLPADDGWNLVANPYASAVDWDDGNWTKTNVADAIYIYNPAVSAYASYVAGVGTNGGSQYIPSQQAFWVQTIGASPVLTVKEPTKSAVDQAFLKTAIPDNTFWLVLTKGNLSNEAAIKISDIANAGYNSTEDAINFPPEIHYIATKAGNDTLSINSLPDNNGKLIIPVIIGNSQGTFSVHAKNIESVLNDYCLVLEDLNTNNKIPLDSNSTYTFSSNKIQPHNRFLLHINRKPAISLINPTCSNSNDGYIVANGPSVAPWSYIWKTINGTVIQQNNFINSSDTLKNISSGVYVIETSSLNNVCGNSFDTISVVAPPPINVSYTSVSPACEGMNSGSVSYTVTGGVPPYEILWNTGSTQNYFLNNLFPGNYSVSVTDDNGCLFTKQIAVNSPPPFIASFVVPDTVYLSEGGKAVFNNQSSSAAYLFEWNFGDGSMVDSTENPIHYYNAVGVYEVTLVISDEVCVDTVSRNITVLEKPLGVSDMIFGRNIHVLFTETGPYIQFNLDIPADAVISVYNILGEEILPSLNRRVHKDNLYINMKSVAEGVYFINIAAGNKNISRKFYFGSAR